MNNVQWSYAKSVGDWDFTFETDGASPTEKACVKQVYKTLITDRHLDVLAGYIDTHTTRNHS